VKRIAVIGVVLENPKESGDEFNSIVGEYSGIIKGRMGLPFNDENIGVVSLVVAADMNQINSFTGKLGKLKDVSVKTAISKREIIKSL